MTEEQKEHIAIDWTEDTGIGIFANEDLVKFRCDNDSKEEIIVRKDNIIGIRYAGETYTSAYTSMDMYSKTGWVFYLLLIQGGIKVVLHKDKFLRKSLDCHRALEFLAGICGLSGKQS